MLTYDQFHPIATRRLPPIRSIVYTGALWGGVQITGFFGAQDNTSSYRLLKSQEYDGIYRDVVNITMQEQMVLFGDTE